MSTSAIEDWSGFEVVEETGVSVETQSLLSETPLKPEEDAERLVAAEPEAREKAIETYKGKVAALVPMDDTTVASCGVFVDECKAAAKRVETEREKLVGPLNTEVKRINAVRIPVRDAFLEMAKSVTERVNKFLEARRIAAELEQKRINDEAAAKQAEIDRKAEEARQEAERIRLEQERQEREAAERERINEARRVELERQRQADIEAAEQAIKDGNETAAREAEERAVATRQAEEKLERKAKEEREAAAVEQTRLAKAAEKADAKADSLDMKASELVPATVQQPTSKVELETSTVSFAGPKATWSLPGWDKKEKIRLVFNGKVDRRLAELVGDLDKLPAGVVFLLTHADLNPVYLNKSFGATEFPHPFAETKDYSGSRRT